MFHIYKDTRTYEDRGYCGRSSFNIPCEFHTLEDAKDFRRDVLMVQNPGVGWTIVDTNTQQEY
jgi:hypothetical protein